MLIKCTECNREISDQATACPGCGAPIRKDNVTAAAGGGAGIQTIEQTSKRWKSTQLAGGILIAIGIVMMFNGDGVAAVGIFAALIGIAMYVYARVGAWWQNG